MSLMKLSDEQMHQLDEQPELVMGLQVMQRSEAPSDAPPIFVLGGQVALVFDEQAVNQISELLKNPWGPVGEQVSEGNQAEFGKWRSELPKAPSMHGGWTRLAFTLPIPGYVPPPPGRPSYVYGHLPFTGMTDPNDVFYRCEPWPVSRRIDQSKQRILADTYASPESELPFFPTGFAAVGRYALPNLMPACFRWELKPIAGTSLDCGASVPLYGQAGGGVEVRFRKNTRNRVAIPNPTVLPPL